MATYDDIHTLLGRPFLPDLIPPCSYCGAGWIVIGPWHPGGQVEAYLVLGCARCKATANGGVP